MITISVLISLSHVLSLSLSFFLSFSLSHSLKLSLFHYLSLSISLSLCLPLSIYLSLFLLYQQISFYFSLLSIYVFCFPLSLTISLFLLPFLVFSLSPFTCESVQKNKKKTFYYTLTIIITQYTYFLNSKILSSGAL